METILIDEKEIVGKFVQLASRANERLINAMQNKHVEMGVNPNAYIGGLECVIYSPDMSIESLIKNLFAVYNNNFQNSIFYQLDNLKKMQTLSMVQGYLREKGLEENFLRWRGEKQSRGDHSHTRGIN